MCIRDSDNAGYNERLPDNETGLVDDENNGEIITYLVMTKNTKGELTIHNVDKFYEIIMWIDPGNCYGIMDKTDLNSYYIIKDNIMYLNKTGMCYVNIRLIFDDGG